jgi:hypothetical protein
MEFRRNERELSRWIATLRRYKSLGTHVELCNRFEAENPGFIWNVAAERNERYIQAIHKFVQTRGHLPKRPGYEENENDLAKWLEGRRIDKKNGVNHALIQRLNIEFPYWAVTHNDMFEMLRNFKVAYADMPRSEPFV